MKRKIKLGCPNCERKLNLTDAQVGKNLVCPKCNTRFRLNNSMIAEVVGPGNRGKTERLKPVSEAIANTSAGKAFEDIDALFSDEDIVNHAKQIASAPALNEISSPSSAQNNAQPNDATMQWEREKRVVNKGDERLGRNGVGFLILAACLSALPFFASSVEELEWLIPYLPAAALAIAFLGTFLLAISKRRSGFATIVLSLFPFVFIAMACAGSHFYFNYLAPKAPVELAQKNEDDGGFEKVEVDADASDPGPLPGDRITIDRDVINNNPAAKFVPGRAAGSDHRPSPRDSEQAGNDSEPVRAEADGHRVDRSGNRPADVRPVRETDFPAIEISDNAGVGVNRGAKIILPKSKKRVSLLQRADKIKTLVSRAEFRGSDDRCAGCSISVVIGEATVYGVAFVIDDIPVRGFDFLSSVGNPTLEIIAPFSGQPMFADSQFSRDEKMMLQGFNINRVDDGIIGLQGVFSDGLGRIELGGWIGRRAENDEFSTIRVEAGQRLTGFVLYRDRFRTVGLGLVTR